MSKAIQPYRHLIKQNPHRVDCFLYILSQIHAGELCGSNISMFHQPVQYCPCWLEEAGSRNFLALDTLMAPIRQLNACNFIFGTFTLTAPTQPLECLK